MAFPMFSTHVCYFLAISTVFRSHISLAAQIQPGIFTLTFAQVKENEVKYLAVPKSLFEGTSVVVSLRPGDEESKEEDAQYTLNWELRYTQCEGIHRQIANSSDALGNLFNAHESMFAMENYIAVTSASSDPIEKATQEGSLGVSYTPVCYAIDTKTAFKNCEKGIQYENPDEDLPDKADDVQADTPDEGQPDTTGTETKPDEGQPDTTGTETKPDEGQPDTTGTETKPDEGQPDTTGTETKPDEGQPDTTGTETKNRRRRAPPDAEAKPDAETKPDAKTKDQHTDQVTNASESGSHLLIVELHVTEGSLEKLEVKIEMKGTHGYLSASQLPLLKFYGIMCGLYILLNFTWLFLLCYQYKDLLGIQIWIGAVIFLGLIEKAVFFAEYEHVNNVGTESQTGVMFPELVSCLKRTLARLLVVVVSIGYGITRPRLGNDLNYIMAAGFLYMILSSAEAIMRTHETYERSMAAILPLSVLDAVLVWWIFRNLVDTTRTLRLRNNDTKLWLYRHFTNTLLLCVALSIIFFFWSIKTHRLNDCLTKWHELWLDDAFWHILFCVILVAVMVLFRPSVNNQRYAYSPLIDNEDEQDEESKEPMLSDAYEGMTMRNLKKDNPQNAVNKIADDLKWVEDNIPAAIADTALSMMDDSEEELVTNLERSKMD
ncbi:transmembrane protein 87A-like isoform X8 [Apostichopus japonicus]|uniref:transmembrane protein 87A-like isoform X2 n=1 Tax=Stichopus japonicus TaxID=307972 RepID=UPI003AB5D10B